MHLQEIHGRRGRKNDSLYMIRNIRLSGRESLTNRQRARLEQAWAADERYVEIEVAWLCAQQLHQAYLQGTPIVGRTIAEKTLGTFVSCMILEVERLGKTLNQWCFEFLGYLDAGGAINGGTESVNGLVELLRRIARGPAAETTTSSVCSS